ncbi:hypothetical protein [Synechococcus sp. BO 8801]|uniref:hypothetical protein n=1 Tax=Synechococcus sp. BO 8801 TaxID=169670 RepID=UPI00117F16D1|nr:hypothetical protein [Synechococcus sp. BO 8801]
MESFTIVTGIASLIGFGIQMFDVFPKLGKHRKEFALISLGIFLGSLIRAFEPSRISLGLAITWSTVVVGLFISAFFLLLLAAAMSDQRDRQAWYSELMRYLVIIFALLVGPRLLFSNQDTTKSLDSVSIRELRMLSESAEARKDYAKAAYYLGIIDERLPANDPRDKVIKNKIKDVQLRELR